MATSPGDAPRDAAGPTGRLGGWLKDVAARLTPTSYVDFSDIPEDSPSPYRARLTLPHELAEANPDLHEREVVRGKVRTVYELRCPCGRRWFSPQLESIQICPRCDRAVLLKDVDSPLSQPAGLSA